MRVLNNIRYIISVLALFVAITGCEKVLDFDKGDLLVDGLTINSLAVADTVFTAYISRAYTFDKMSAFTGSDFWMLEYAMYGSYDEFYKDSAVVKDAAVQLTVNESEKYVMEYDPVSYSYKSTYTPVEGDHLKLSVEHKDYPVAYSDVEVPEKEKVEVVSCEKIYSKKSAVHFSGIFSDYRGKDSVARITLRILDPVEQKNFYRLKVRGYAQSINSYGRIKYMHNDVYTSADIIFKDDALTKGYRGWPAYFSNIFTDQLFNGKNYEFTVESRLRNGEPGSNYVVVELQSITKELYYYLKSTMLYRITEQDTYTEPIIIHSNIEDGWGILGGVSYDRHILKL